MFALLLLVVVFLGFGVVAEACIPETQADAQSVSHQEIHLAADK